MNKIENDLFLKACHKEYTHRTPIWIMRQAGRYLPEYRAVRKNHDFLTMCKTPELAAKVTIQPIDILEVDAAILFSDILVIPEAMGMELIMTENKGPVFPKPITGTDDINRLKRVDPSKDLKYVMDAIKLVKTELNGRVPLIGFSGSPFTLLTYIIEGGSSKNFDKVKSFMYNRPNEAFHLLDLLSEIIGDYLSMQIESGVDAIQIFDTWGGILSQSDYKTYSLPYIEKAVELTHRFRQPMIIFSKGVHHSLDVISNLNIDVVGVDWTMNLGEVRNITGNKVALQGNLDPSILFAPKSKIKSEALRVLMSYGEGSGHIFNLGHGIMPNVDPENLKYLIEVVKKESAILHKMKY